MVLEGAGTLRVSDDLGGKFADKFSDAVISTDNSYQSQDLSITVTPYHTGSGDNKISYYVADIYTSNLRLASPSATARFTGQSPPLPTSASYTRTAK